MENKELKEILAKILGEEATNNDMETPKNVIKLTKAVNYLATQMSIIGKTCNEEDKDYIDRVIENVKEILNK